MRSTHTHSRTHAERGTPSVDTHTDAHMLQSVCVCVCVSVANTVFREIVATLPKHFRFRLPLRFRDAEAAGLPPGGSYNRVATVRTISTISETELSSSLVFLLLLPIYCKRNSASVCLCCHTKCAACGTSGRHQKKRARQHWKTVNRWRQ